MSAPSSTNSPAQSVFQRYTWWLVLAAALAGLAWANHLRIARVEFVTNTESWSVPPPEVERASASGFAREQRRLIVPQHHSTSYAWIMNTQLMLARGDWRMRHLDYENAPAGRPSHATMPYRWWLALVGWVDHLGSGRSLGAGIEHGALYADPLLHALLLISLVWVAARQGGLPAACALAVAAIGIYPLAGNFQPGAPDHHALAWLLACWSVLPWMAARRTTEANESPGGAIAAGIAGGLALWVDATTATPVIAGLGAGAIVAALRAPRTGAVSAMHLRAWRVWSWIGATVVLIAAAAEFFPSHLTWRIDAVHPLHAVAWCGLAELVALAALARQRGAAGWTRGAWARTALAVLAVAALPVTMLVTASGGVLASDPFAAELVNLPDAPSAPGFRGWLQRDGFSLAMLATVAPLGVLIVAGLRLRKAATSEADRRLLWLALGPALFALILGWFQLRWWNLANAAMLVLLVALLRTLRPAGNAPAAAWGWALGCLVLLVPGWRLIVQSTGARADAPLNENEVEDIVTRDLASWLAQRSDAGAPVVLFSTPAVSEALAFHGGLKVVGSFSPENREGFSAAVRIASASTWDEAFALISHRGITHIVLPAWDPVLGGLVRLGRRVPPGAELPRDSLLAQLERWSLPPWLRPVAYPVPGDPGFEGCGVTVLVVQPEQDEALNACRLADFFLETNQLEPARAARAQLQLYPRHPAALAMLAQVNLTLGDTAGHQQALEALLPHLGRRSIRALPLDRRISLAALLTNARQNEPAAEQVRLCMADVDAARLRELSPGALVRLVALAKVHKIDFPDPSLRPLALALMPPKLRARLEPGAAARP